MSELRTTVRFVAKCAGSGEDTSYLNSYTRNGTWMICAREVFQALGSKFPLPEKIEVRLSKRAFAGCSQVYVYLSEGDKRWRYTREGYWWSSPLYASLSRILCSMFGKRNTPATGRKLYYSITAV